MATMLRKNIISVNEFGYIRYNPRNMRSKPTNAAFLLNLYIPCVMSFVTVDLSIPTLHEVRMAIIACMKMEHPRATTPTPIK
ncbi:hypothetical protein D3C71_1714850 [compost metagenome]